MPESQFLQLEEEKRKRIIEAGIKEFARQSYPEASTNHLVKVAGISKGSLFKYFINKEDLYFYLLDQVIADLMSGITTEIQSLRGDLFTVILRFAEIEFTWHYKNPEAYQLMKRAFTDDGSEMYRKTLERYNATGDSMYEQLLTDIDTSQLLWEKERTIKLVKWTLEGFNKEFMKRYQQIEDITTLKEDYLEELHEYLQMIGSGVTKTVKSTDKGVDDHV